MEIIFQEKAKYDVKGLSRLQEDVASPMLILVPTDKKAKLMAGPSSSFGSSLGPPVWHGKGVTKVMPPLYTT